MKDKKMKDKMKDKILDEEASLVTAWLSLNLVHHCQCC